MRKLLLVAVVLVVAGGGAAVVAALHKSKAFVSNIPAQIRSTEQREQPAAQQAAGQQVGCPAGYGLSSMGDCLDERHLPCPHGYTGYQNTRVDNCLEKPGP